MISFKSFVIAIHDAIIEASVTLRNKNVRLLDEYFEPVPPDENTVAKGIPGTVGTIRPRTAVLQYPRATADGGVENQEVHVPLVTLVPLGFSQIEKATLTADFDIEIVDGDLQLNFTSKSGRGLFGRKGNVTRGKLEIVISPQETPEGIKLLVEGYEAVLKRQIS